MSADIIESLAQYNGRKVGYIPQTPEVVGKYLLDPGADAWSAAPVRALGPQRVLGLILPERASAPRPRRPDGCAIRVAAVSCEGT